jgi:predicted transcriptional regulator
VASAANATALNVQPRQRRAVYEALAGAPTGCSVKELLGELDMPEPDLRSSLRKLDEAGLALRVKGRWSAVPLEPSEPAPADTE